MNRVQANGIDFAYLEDGPQEAPLVLCLHGFPDHAPTYARLLEDLAGNGFHAVAPWMRGYHPTSIPSDGRYQTAALALDAIALADQLAGDRDAFVIGHDWGAAASYLACAYKPERFKRLVALAVPHTAGLAGKFVTDYRQMKRSWYMFFFQLQALPEMSLQAGDFAMIDFLWKEWSPGLRPDPEFMKALKQTFASPGTVEAALGYYRALFDPSRHDPALDQVQAAGFQPVGVPALYLHGADDGVISIDLAGAEEVKAFFPAGLDMQVIPNSGHFLHLEQPEQVNSHILKFLTA